MLIRTLLISLLTWISFNGNSQQDALFSQYMFNPFAINPAYAGSRNSVSAVMLYRSQWVGFDGAPNTGTISVHSPIKGKKFALGMTLIAEEIGPATNSGISGSYAYHLKMPTGKLSLALRAGFFTTALDKNRLNFTNSTDISNTGGKITGVTPNFDFGAYYYTDHFFAGFSANHLSGQTINFSDDVSNAEYKLNQAFIITTGYAYKLSESLVIKPSTRFNYTVNSPINLDLNFSVLFSKVFWLGVSYRSTGSLILITEYNALNFMRIGYSYDFSTGNLKTVNTGSHEVFIGFDFGVGNKKTISPRYL